MKVQFTIEPGNVYQLTIIAENDIEAVALRVWSDLHEQAPASAVLLLRSQASDGSLMNTAH